MADLAQLQHLLRRTEFVAKQSRIDALIGGTLDAAVDDILNVTTPVALPAYIDHNIDNMGYEQFVYAVQWWMDLMVDSAKPMQERMTFFWHGHFTSAWNKVGDTRAMMTQNKLLRDNALGNFYDLTQKVAIDPAMLVYLDNRDNVKGSPNENFARELMELFTLGVGNYTEADIAAAAKAWTGHGIDTTTTSPTYGLYKYTDSRHDKTNKTFFGTTKNWNGPDIISEILHDNAEKRFLAARYVINRLWEHFAHPGTPTTVLDALWENFAGTWDIKALMRAMLLRPEFYAPAAMQRQVRSPVEWIVSVMYQTGRRSAEMHPEYYLDEMGQEPYNPPNVAGWKHNAYWVNTSTMGERGNFAKDIANRLRTPDTYAFISAKTGVNWNTSIDQAIDTITNLFGIGPLSGPTRNAMAAYLTAERGPGGDRWWQVTNLLTMGLLAPEMHVA